MQTTTNRKARRKLSDIDFSSEDSHIALCTKEQGTANDAAYKLVVKATSQFSEEFVAKASKIKVEMQIEDFLVRFYGLWHEEAEVLARALGFTTSSMEREDSEEEYELESYEDYIQSKVNSIEVFKSLSETESIPEVLSTLSEEEYLSMLQDQSRLEKAFRKIDREKKQLNKQAGVKLVKESESVKSTENDTSDNIVHEVSNEVKSSDETLTKGKVLMTQEVKTIEQEVEVVEKAQFDLVQKALDEQRVNLEKAMETIAKFEQEKKEAIVKAKTSAIQAVVKNEKQAVVVLKAALALEDQADFDAFVQTMKDMHEQIEKSALFQEQGITADTEEKASEKESAVARLIKAQFANK